MRIVGGPRDGQAISISEQPGGPELGLEGMVLEYSFTTPGQVNVKLSADSDPAPSLPGLLERYKCREGAWHYIPPSGNREFRMSPPVVTE